MEKKEKIPCWQKVNLTIQEAAEYSNIGQTTIRELLKQKNCNFLLKVGNKQLIKRKEFDIFFLHLSGLYLTLIYAVQTD